MTTDATRRVRGCVCCEKYPICVSYRTSGDDDDIDVELRIRCGIFAYTQTQTHVEVLQAQLNGVISCARPGNIWVDFRIGVVFAECFCVGASTATEMSIIFAHSRDGRRMQLKSIHKFRLIHARQKLTLLLLEYVVNCGRHMFVSNECGHTAV